MDSQSTPPTPQGRPDGGVFPLENLADSSKSVPNLGQRAPFPSDFAQFCEETAEKREQPRLYTEFSAWWPVLSAPEEYRIEAGFYLGILEARGVLAPGRARPTLLELGCGGGSNAYYLKERFEVTLVDRAPGMLAVSRRLNPDCEHLLGDMRDVRLGRLFDVVFIHDAICYMTTPADLARAIRTAWEHCRPGGVALFHPDETAETFRALTDHGGQDGPGRSLRYLEWTYDPDPADTTYITDMAYLLRDEAGRVRSVYDRHVMGLFSQDHWMRTLAEAGFEASMIPFEHPEVDPGTSHLFVGRRRA